MGTTEAFGVDPGLELGSLGEDASHVTREFLRRLPMAQLALLIASPFSLFICGLLVSLLSENMAPLHCKF